MINVPHVSCRETIERFEGDEQQKRIVMFCMSIGLWVVPLEFIGYRNPTKEDIVRESRRRYGFMMLSQNDAPVGRWKKAKLVAWLNTHPIKGECVDFLRTVFESSSISMELTPPLQQQGAEAVAAAVTAESPPLLEAPRATDPGNAILTEHGEATHTEDSKGKTVSDQQPFADAHG